MSVRGHAPTPVARVVARRQGRERDKGRAQVVAPTATSVPIREVSLEDIYILENHQVQDEGADPDQVPLEFIATPVHQDTLAYAQIFERNDSGWSLAMLGTRGLVLPVVILAPHPEVEIFLQRVSSHLLADRFRQLFSRLRKVILDEVATARDRVPRGHIKRNRPRLGQRSQ
ncbi:hypothetical protein HAX54_023761 [Datura stramonium]|uniref:Uncharacterized protein n=1 Tax=Datura stramonium TaxID=4076 RepID=A0ABS8S593_DATST|nr:hypothetical protein [Datura stramonium]